jgi:hypothetical protein
MCTLISGFHLNKSHHALVPLVGNEAIDNGVTLYYDEV